MFGHMIMSAAEVVAFAVNGTNVTAQSYFTNGDWVSGKKKRLIIPSGVTIGSTSSSQPALRTGTGYGGILQIENSGWILGAGGVPNSGIGGDAFYADNYVILLNYGLIYGGGGAGGLGGIGGGGSYGYTLREPTSGDYYNAQNPVYDYWNYGSASHCHWNGTDLGGQNGNMSFTNGGYTYYAGQYIADATSGGQVFGTVYAIYRTSTATAFSSGGSGGNGGRGYGYDGANATGIGGSAGGTNAGTGGTGGTGGGWGATGATGATGQTGNYTGGSAGSAGGLAGYSLRNISYVNMMTNTGTLLGRT